MSRRPRRGRGGRISVVTDEVDLAFTLQLLDDWLEANNHLWQDFLEDSLAGF